MLDAVIFDYDGVISSTSLRQERWFRHYASLHSKEWPFQSFEQFLMFYNEKCALPGGVQNVYDALDLPCNMNDRAHPVWPAYEQFNQDNPSQPYEGIVETIRTIWEMGQLGKDPLRNRRLRLGINSSNTWKTIYADLLRSGALPYFDAFITEEVLREYQGGDSEVISKPSPISLALVLGLLGSEEGCALHVGDTRNDLRASQKIMRLNPRRPEKTITVGACWGYEGRELLEQGTVLPEGRRIHFDHLIDHPRELVPIVRDYLSSD